MGFKALVQQSIDAIKQKAGVAAPKNNPNSVKALLKEAGKDIFRNVGNSPFYAVSAEDWYKAYPYRFKMVVGSKTTYYSLPIPPEALNYQMVSASQLIPTLGGVVEETSATVFWQVSLSGTTGIAISRKYTDDSDTLDMPASKEDNFRRVLKGGIFANTFNKAANVLDAVSGAFNGDGSTGAALGLLEGLASTAQRYNSSAVKAKVSQNDDTVSKVSNLFNLDLSRFRENNATSTNGYVEIHLLHNFLNAYSYLKESNPEETALYFESQKDNMQWQVIVKAFTFQKNANQPYLYKYNIALQGFNLKEVGAGDRKVIDRFGPDGDLGGVSSFTLSGAAERAQSLTRKITTNPLGLIASKPPII